MLSLHNVTLRLKGQTVLRNISVDIPPNAVTALIGPGASGKSVLFKVFAGLLEPDRGQVFVDGECITGMPPLELARVRKKIGLQFQNNALFDHMTVAENIAFPMRRLFDYSEHEIAQVIAERLGHVSLAGFQDRMPPGLSGGQKKRVGFARATAMRAPIVLCDEPTAGLDPVNSQKIFNLIRDDQQQMQSTSIVISSDVAGVLSIADHVIMLHRGEMLFSGPLHAAQHSGIAAVHQFVYGLTEGPL